MVFSRSERGVWCWVRINWDIVDIWDPLAKGGWGDGTLVSQDPLMIGMWKRRKASWGGYMGRECAVMWKTWCFGLKQRVGSSSPRLASLLRKLRGAKL
ncbi:hypothetical protein CK203_075680 [Vitis vinifera]|uniref:Uncharacterized protein n=1 Tax=Vitis vinifera TaxID=29760 RepID=A0A438EGP3_VITVI|nr:hypothetical protein CK203_075680 [Vitis vinifera]